MTCILKFKLLFWCISNSAYSLSTCPVFACQPASQFVVVYLQISWSNVSTEVLCQETHVTSLWRPCRKSIAWSDIWRAELEACNRSYISRSHSIAWANTKLLGRELSVTPCCMVLRICVSNLGHHWIGWWLVTYSVPSHYLNKCWIIVKQTLRK